MAADPDIGDDEEGELKELKLAHYEDVRLTMGGDEAKSVIPAKSGVDSDADDIAHALEAIDSLAHSPAPLHAEQMAAPIDPPLDLSGVQPGIPQAHELQAIPESILKKIKA